LFNAMAGVDLVHVPYKGSGPAITDLLAGQVEINFSSIAGSLPFVREGRLRALAVTGPGRSSVVPDIPTVSESGLPGYEVGNWYGILAPATTPGSIVARINGAMNRALVAADLRKRFLELAADPLGGTPEQFGAYARSELAKWARAIHAAAIRPETM
jgi:tripartite-type tricarboxylate transporter receptor subunit TctC